MQSSKKQVENLLVVGIDTVAIAKSAREAGYKVYAADYFGDLDLRRICSGWESILNQRERKSGEKVEAELNPEYFLKMAESLGKLYRIDRSLISSGLDDFPDILLRLDDIVPILGNNPKVTEQVRKKPEFFNHLKRLGIPHPKTIVVKSLDQARAAATEIGYPLIVKPTEGFAGVDTIKAANLEQLEQAFLEASKASKRLLIQEFIEGTPASVSLIASRKKIRILTLNEQLLGAQFLFQPESLGYCGNIVPLDVRDSVSKECIHISKKIALKFSLEGSNGIDLVISKRDIPYVMEVNPRFQGTMECIERVLGLNLVKAHIDACLYGVLPSLKEKRPTYCTRLILHTPKRIVTPDLTVFPEVRDIPLPGTIIEKGEPLCSIIIEGNSRKNSFQKGKKLAKSIYNMISPA